MTSTPSQASPHQAREDLLAQALKEVAVYAARQAIRGRSFKRNSLLKPLDIILAELGRYPKELEFARDSSKGLIFDHLQRIRGWVSEAAIYEYVDLFFEKVLQQALGNHVGKLLQRERSLRSAYLVYVRQELARVLLEKKQAASPEEALAQLETEEAEEAGEPAEAGPALD
ncbi:MAG: hypothetical protein IMW90_17835 [Thermogemmatispora sp.]|uniref:Uncharacterized protein n=1 Tax=Thermogemmatispora aurantia TaxID=2045279 RepID=A0A5J4K448_9CHLR|nr:MULTISPECIES: hypothetical protein [Thermogemmatispora]MBE3567579.1 hypothetical protein [Thermogemmatispora sp.]GER83434.1 hypothetical protein KTAU_20710 [Thermogemmatispora aurantia]